ncbi:ABC transporter permease [Nocardioides sp. CER19]|uniref:ABC transporter permease n=1 Tax=Nocardioides sp. CER19 TaxID=3038538 RepID=UPI0024497763|nr:ABC transporter permease [Nocardioides sp. CER19]MDH2413003.1 ABC transporter permease [Nocardioides sp. CER19]
MSDTEQLPATAVAAAPEQLTEPRRRPAWLQNPAAKYSLLVVWAAMAAYFWFAVPGGLFHTTGTFRSIFGSMQAMVLVFLAMSAVITLVVGEFDLSIASVMGISATTAAVLGGLHDVNPVLACLAAIGVGALAGAANAFFVVVMGVSSFVVTLGMGTVWMGVAEMVSHNNYVSMSSPGLKSFATTSVLGMPVAFYYGVGLALVLAYLLAWTPLGRSMIFIGANPEVARLAGVRVAPIRFGAYVAGGVLAAFAGILIVASVGSFDNSTSSSYLLPALAAVFLGTAVIQPGMFNPLGTLVAIYFLQTGILGLQLLGYDTWIQNVFYGLGLVVAVTLAKVVRDRAKGA